MEDNSLHTPITESPARSADNGADQGSSRKGLIIAGVVAVVVLALLIAGAIFLVRADPQTTSQIRDVFIIFMALESLVIGAAMIILIVQVAILTNLLQNEIKPILDSTSETVNTMRGTVSFLADNLVQPVIRINSYVAGAKKFVDLIRPGR